MPGEVVHRVCRSDVALNLLPGTSAVWQRLSGPLPVENVRDLAELGAIEESGIGAVRLSGTRRSAGITYWHRSKWRSSEMPVGAALVVE